MWSLRRPAVAQLVLSSSMPTISALEPVRDISIHFVNKAVTNFVRYHSVTVGDKSFTIAQMSRDGVSCSRIYSPDVAVVECSGLQIEIPDAAQSADCFVDEDAKASFLALKSRSLAMRAPIKLPTPSEHSSAITNYSPSSLRARQIGCGISGGTELVGDGNPHQNYLHKQLSVRTRLPCSSPLHPECDQLINSFIRNNTPARMPLLVSSADLTPNPTRSVSPFLAPQTAFLTRGSLYRKSGQQATSTIATVILEMSSASGIISRTLPVSYWFRAMRPTLTSCYRHDQALLIQQLRHRNEILQG